MSTLVGPLLSLLLGLSEPEESRIPPPPPLPVPSEAAVLRSLTDWLWRDSPFRVSPLFDVDRAEGLEGAKATPPEVLRELEAWSRSVRPARTISFEFQSFVYAAAAGTEFRSRGIATSTGKEIRVEAQPRLGLHNGPSLRRGRDGRPLRVVTADAEVLTSDRREVSTAGSRRKRTRIATFPPQAVAPDMVTQPFFSVPQLRLLDPFYEFDAAARARAYRVSFGPRHLPGRQIHLVLVGKSADWQREFDRVEVLLKPHTHEPIAIRWIEPGATRETIYVFKNVSRK